jgi:hypothetical protein
MSTSLATKGAVGGAISLATKGVLWRRATVLWRYVQPTIVFMKKAPTRIFKRVAPKRVFKHDGVDT